MADASGDAASVLNAAFLIFGYRAFKYTFNLKLIACMLRSSLQSYCKSSMH